MAKLLFLKSSKKTNKNNDLYFLKTIKKSSKKAHF